MTTSHNSCKSSRQLPPGLLIIELLKIFCHFIHCPPEYSQQSCLCWDADWTSQSDPLLGLKCKYSADTIHLKFIIAWRLSKSVLKSSWHDHQSKISQMMTNLITEMHYSIVCSITILLGAGPGRDAEWVRSPSISTPSLWPRILRVSASGPRTPGSGLRRPMGGWRGLRGMSVVRTRFEKVLLNFFSASSNFSYSWSSKNRVYNRI